MGRNIKILGIEIVVNAECSGLLPYGRVAFRPCKLHIVGSK